MSFPIVIVGSARSGTSALNASLRLALDMPSFYEGHIWPFLRGLLDQLTVYRTRMNESFGGFPGAVVLSKSEAEIRQTIGRSVMASLYGHPDRWIDKTPGGEMIAALPVLHEIYSHNMRAIFMQRHPLDVVMSMKRKFSDRLLSTQVNDWSSTQEAWHRVRGGLDSYIEIRYDDLIERTATVVEHIATYIGMTTPQRLRLHQELRGNRSTERTLIREQEIEEISISELGGNDDIDLFRARCEKIAHASGFPNVDAVRYDRSSDCLDCLQFDFKFRDSSAFVSVPTSYQLPILKVGLVDGGLSVHSPSNITLSIKDRSGAVMLGPVSFDKVAVIELPLACKSQEMEIVISGVESVDKLSHFFLTVRD